jgi:hypothetical protein
MIPQVLTGFFREDGRYAPSYLAPLAPAATVTANGNGDTYEMGAATVLRLTRAVTASSGSTPTLDVVVETSRDNSTWRAVGQFPPMTTTGSDDITFAGLDRYARVRWAVGGTTPSFTFSVTGHAIGQ